MILWCNYLVAEPYALLSQRCEVSQIILLLLLQVSYHLIDWWNWWHHFYRLCPCSTPSATWARSILTCWLNIPRTSWIQSALVSHNYDDNCINFQSCSFRSSDEPWPLHIAAITYSEFTITVMCNVASFHCFSQLQISVENKKYDEIKVIQPLIWWVELVMITWPILCVLISLSTTGSYWHQSSSISSCYWPKLTTPTEHQYSDSLYYSYILS